MKWKMKRRRNLRRWTLLGVKRKMMMVRVKSTVKVPVKERFRYCIFTNHGVSTGLFILQKLLDGEINEQIRIGNCLFFSLFCHTVLGCAKLIFCVQVMRRTGAAAQ